MRRSPSLRSRAIAAAVALAALAACAKVAPPPGGPEDRDPPTVVETFPPDGAGAVAPDSAVILTFSEKLDRRSVMRSLRVIPPVDFRETSWEEERLTLRPESGWPKGRNTLIRIGEGAKDRRGNELGEAFSIRFSTKAVPDTGFATGRVWPGRERSRRTRPVVLAFAIRGDSLPDPDVAHPDAVAEPGPQGRFRLDGLDPGVGWRIVGILDVDDDLRALSAGEARGEPELVPAFVDSVPSITIPDFLIGTLDSLGEIAGEVLADSGSPVRVFARELPDETAGVEEAVPGGGSFALEVPTGKSYRVGAFVDADGDSLPGEEELLVETEKPVELLLIGGRGDLELDLRSPPDTSLADSTGAAGAAERDAPNADGAQDDVESAKRAERGEERAEGDERDETKEGGR